VSDAVAAYTLFQAEILNLLNDRKWFIECMAINFYCIGSRWGCSVEVSERRLGEACDFWKVDAKRTLDSGIEKGAKELDHFKHASFIAFWLRRQIPINKTMFLRAGGRVHSGIACSSEQKFFIQYGNEICALGIGLELCLYYEFIGKNTSTSNVQSITPDRLDYIKSCKLKSDSIRDYTMVLKHKNMSPHALYLLYKSLFTNLHAGSSRRSP